ncbi:MAG TPA: EAL domain-containing protein [Acidimicrobiales bacterium]|nr:EAL domain-containing protein [Acidimicrobiales bacterium]
MATVNFLSTQHLVEFMAYVSAAGDEKTAIRNAAECAAQLLEAEFAAVVLADRVVHTLGFSPGHCPEEDVLRAAGMLRGSIDVAGIGVCLSVVGRETGDPPVRLLVARMPGDGFTAEEVDLVRGMGRALGLTLRMLRILTAERSLHEQSQRQADENAALLRSLRDRQQLLERLSVVQRAVSRHEPIAGIFQMIVEGAQHLVGERAAVSLHLNNAGLGGQPAALLPPPPVPEGELCHRGVADLGAAAAAAAVAADAVACTGRASEGPAEARPRAGAIAAPVREGLTTVGALSLTAAEETTAFGPEDEAMLVAFADHASLALGEARALAEMRRAQHDSLTGLPSRALFLESLEGCLGKPGPVSEEVAVLFIDLDRFKLINDTLGHGVGDLLLVEVARRITSALRASDLAARIGGDEFAVMLVARDCSARALAIAERLISHLSSPYAIGGQRLYVGASVGIALAYAGTKAEDLVQDADIAMYHAKKAGRGRYSLFEPGMRASFFNRVQVEADLRRALLNGEMAIHYQPIVRLDGGLPLGAEALVRWPHPEKGMIPPLEFLPFVDEIGLMPLLDALVVRQGCAQAMAWRGAGRALALHVNVAAGQIQQGSFVSDLSASLANSGLPPELLTLELSEPFSALDGDISNRNAERLKDLGIKLAVDAFGTSGSALARAHRFPFDIVKVDRSVIAGIATNPRAFALASGVAELAHSLGLEVMAEGVEDEVEAGLLLAAGYEVGQGYHFGAPVPGPEFWATVCRGRALAGRPLAPPA